MKSHVVAFFAGLIFGLGLMALLAKTVFPINPTKTTLEITGPEGKGGFSLKVEGEPINYEKVLERLFTGTFMRSGVTGWLAQKEKVYSIESEEVVTAIATQLCGPIPESPPDEKLRKEQECANKPIVMRLRDIAFNHRAPFHYVGKKSEMGVPEIKHDQPLAGRASVCRHGDFLGKKLQIGNLLNNSVVVVEATGSYDCTPAAKYPDVQLSPDDALRLFPKVSLKKLQSVIIVSLE